jgi:hypothetical protein
MQLVVCSVVQPQVSINICYKIAVLQYSIKRRGKDLTNCPGRAVATSDKYQGRSSVKLTSLRIRQQRKTGCRCVVIQV